MNTWPKFAPDDIIKIEVEAIPSGGRFNLRVDAIIDEILVSLGMPPALISEPGIIEAEYCMLSDLALGDGS